MSEVSEVVEQFEGQVSDDVVKAAQEADLIPTGRYRFQVESYDVKRGDMEFWDKEQTRPNAFFGKQVGNLRIRLTAQREGGKAKGNWTTLDRPRTTFMRVTPALVYNDKHELVQEAKLFGQMAAVAKNGSGVLPSNQAVIEHFIDNPGEINITLSEATEKYEAKNWYRGIRGI